MGKGPTGKVSPPRERVKSPPRERGKEQGQKSTFLIGRRGREGHTFLPYFENRLLEQTRYVADSKTEDFDFGERCQRNLNKQFAFG